MIRPVALLVAIAGLLGVSEAKALHIIPRGGGHRGVATTMTYGGVIAGTSSTIQAPSVSSYNDFTFHGAPYGRPYAPWTWPYMSGSYGRGLARYYDPPVK